MYPKRMRRKLAGLHVLESRRSLTNSVYDFVHSYKFSIICILLSTNTELTVDNLT